MTQPQPSTIKLRITDDMKTAMRNQDKERLATIRLILAACKQKEVDERITLTDEHVIAILDKMLKQRRESITQYEAGNRPDLAKIELDEVQIIQQYLPAQLTPQEIDALIVAAIQESGATSVRDMGKVMAILRSQVQGRADVASVSNLVKEKLAG
jgi:uncharacterized protein YqeY